MVGVGVKVGLGVIVGVDVAVGLDVEVGTGVLVGDGVKVGPNICPGPQPETRRLSAKIYIAVALLFVFIVLLHCHGRPRGLLKRAAQLVASRSKPAGAAAFWWLNSFWAVAF